MNITTVFERYKNMAETVRSSNTARSYGRAINIFGEFLNTKGIDLDKEIEQITPDNFIEFPGWLIKRGYARKSINVYMSGAKFLMDHMVIEKLLELTYYDTVRYQTAARDIYKKREAKLPRFPKKDDVSKMITAVHQFEIESPRYERNIAIVQFLASSGCRNSEIVQLNIGDLDLEDCSAIVTGKGERQRRIFFNQDTKQTLEKYWIARKNKSASSPVFTRHDRGVGKKIKRLTTTTIRNVINDVAIMAGIDPLIFSPHYFRHAFAIKALNKTHDLALVQDLLGHTSPVATRIYAKIYPEDLSKAHKKIFD